MLVDSASSRLRPSREQALVEGSHYRNRID
jgi:hypothetical protein